MKSTDKPICEYFNTDLTVKYILTDWHKNLDIPYDLTNLPTDGTQYIDEIIINYLIILKFKKVNFIRSDVFVLGYAACYNILSKYWTSIKGKIVLIWLAN